ncbi:hypothetical protein DFJ43DRAFT_1070150 [Lentinula guzmanii]|uniref:Uncharacterized protein n=1 Tax=Lentinula guzmanii TaxID=2804957 RepID=A0AA38N1S0_9AGAR|nr:hypothetical protein DFJ43DRAFT_1070150 [Lentinula guzmanii]
MLPWKKNLWCAFALRLETLLKILDSVVVELLFISIITMLSCAPHISVDILKHYFPWNGYSEPKCCMARVGYWNSDGDSFG